MSDYMPLGCCVKSFEGYISFINVAIQLKTGQVVSGSGDHTLFIWDVDSAVPTAILFGHTSSIYSLIELKNGNIVSSGFDGTIQVWNLKKTYKKFDIVFC
jgi:WD40 repeat protein